MLAVVMLINRSGTMVLPFFSIYLTEALGYDLKQAGIILSLFGLGSMVGSLLGGSLTDRLGHFWVQTGSLMIGGVLFVVLSGVQQFTTLAVGIFLLSLVAESLRPANATSISVYAKRENISRAFSLVRMAINLGFSIGPAIGGLLAAISFRWLFVGDGITCMLAGLFFYFFFRNRQGNVSQQQELKVGVVNRATPYRDINFIAYFFLTFLYAVVFFQLFITLPLYYRNIYELNEKSIGLLMAVNGMVVFVLEMVLVYLLGKWLHIRVVIALGMLLTGLAFALLNFSSGHLILYLSMVALSVAEIVAMPFMMTYVSQISMQENRGAYMGMFTLAYSSAHVVAPYYGTKIIDTYGFDILWWTGGMLMLVTAVGFYINIKLRKNNNQPSAASL